jgi:hypothetical protein
MYHPDDHHSFNQGVNEMKTQRLLVRLLATSIAIATAGCATILNDETQKVNVASSTGEKFSFSIDGQTYEGPIIIDVARTKADKIILAESPNCVKQTLLPAEVDGKFWINILSGGVFGSTTDYSSEEMWGYESNVVVTCSK